jgi:hypothetical protein
MSKCLNSVLDTLHMCWGAATQSPTWKALKDLQVLQAAEAQAERVQRWQTEYHHLHSQLLNSTAAMARASSGIQIAIGALAATQARSERALSSLLGSAYTWTDVASYGGGTVAVLLLSAFESCSRPRWLLCSLLATWLALERGSLALIVWHMVRTPFTETLHTHAARL